MTNLFDNIPVDSETNIITEYQAKFDKYHILYQKWHWQGIHAESIIFINDEILDFSEDSLIEFVKDSPMIKKHTKLTLTKKENYTFVNFNFKN